MFLMLSSLLSVSLAEIPKSLETEYTLPIGQVETIGVLQFSVTTDGGQGISNADVVLSSLEERTRQEMLPLLRQHTEIQLVTPENLNISGDLPVGGRLLETGRALGLTYVVTGTVLVNSSAEIILKLYHVQTGVLLQQKSIRAESPNALLNYVPTILDDLLLPLLNMGKNKDAPNVLVSFEAEPRENTLLFVDGKVVCQTLPCTQKVQQGTHNIQFHNPYYEVWAEDQYLTAGVDVQASLKASFGFVTVNSEPEGIQFQIDGVSMGKTPLNKHRIEQGEHKVSVLDPCYTARDAYITIQNNRNERVNIEGIARQAGINVYLENPSQKAKVYVDGQYLGDTPLSTSVPMCSEKLYVENSYGEYTGIMSLRESEVEKFVVPLQKKKRHKKERVTAAPKSNGDSFWQRRKSRSRRFNPTHSIWTTYTVNYGLDNGDVRLGLGSFQVKDGRNDSFIAPLLPAVRGQFIDYSATSYQGHHLLPFGIGYAFDLEIGLIQPFYQWHWLTLADFDLIDTWDDFYHESIYTPDIHKVGLDFMMNNNPLKRRSHIQGGTLQAQVSYTYCADGPTEFCREDLFVGASLYLMSGRWGF